MRRYESIFIIHPDLPDVEINETVDRYAAIIENQAGKLVKIEKWGKRKLAYEIKKQTRGYYVLMDYVGAPGVVSELERNFKIDDKVLKYMTVKRDEDVDMEAVEKEIAAAAQARQVEAPAEEAPSSPETEASQE
ncbi:MAG TPA: 30S ribosomal protein S6 [Syntrophales bacterium]|nr:30S ribosomal protein S6 [Syntrophales bacterium]HOM08078.1 30S ribosomal protein S6 [Syntrophales bacterium]HOO00820.1 30S ribosomal protein S6 [Syntrophales bacterium]HPC01980.1 30S ribosomal protein S6 [Syntrophales bacterium]HPQ07490.1 30S ribosomal protein S6 [Syntrophales bacterium]